VPLYRFLLHAGQCPAAVCLWCVLSLSACGASSASQNIAAENARPRLAASLQDNKGAPPSSYGAARPVPAGSAAVCWLPLVQRLQQDSAAPPDVLRYFALLPEYSPSPMGAKIRELFTSAFMRKAKPPTEGIKPPPLRIYRNVVTQANMDKCREFLATNKLFFDAVEKKHPVPREVLVSLLFVETRLGTFLGNENAFWSLACIAAADTPDSVRAGLGDLPITAQHDAWLQGKLADKSAWAYKELRALLAFCSLYNLDPHAIPGSVYGAIGLCQFMPSNLAPYAEDGDGDGVINLFSAGDAIFSAAHYLSKHGWKSGAGVAAQRLVLKRYNNLAIYANTILALAESLRTGIVQTGPPDSPKIKAAAGAGKKRAAKPGAAKKAKEQPGKQTKKQ
jgi:membrane-bound lytic murein transglycosylase B